MPEVIDPPAAPAPSPATPAPSPAPATPAPAPTPTDDGRSSIDAFESQFSDLAEAPAKPEPTPAPSPAPAAAAPTPKPAPKPAAPAPEPDEFSAPKAGSMESVRSWGNRMAAGFKKATSEAKQLRSELEQAKNAPVKNAPEIAALSEQLKQAQSKITDYENSLRLTRYERSEEYAKNFEKPWKDAQVRAARDIKQMVVYENNPEDPERPNERAATESDFEEIYALPLGKAANAAQQRFGPAQAALVMQHYTRLHEAAESAYNAIQEHRTKGEQFEKEQVARTAQEAQERDSLWQRAHAQLVEKHSKWFDVHEGDSAWNEALNKGREIANLKFTNAYDRLTPQQKVSLDAQIYHRAAAFPALKAKMEGLEAQLAEANKTIEELRGSGPGKPTPAGEVPPVEETSTMEAFDKRF